MTLILFLIGMGGLLVAGIYLLKIVSCYVNPWLMNQIQDYKNKIVIAIIIILFLVCYEVYLLANYLY